LNLSQPTSPSSQPAIEPTQEDVVNYVDSDDEMSPPSDPSLNYDATPHEESNSGQVTEQPTGLVDMDTDDVSDEIAGQIEASLSRPQQDGNTSGQEEAGQEEDSDFEFIAEDAETDSDSEADLPPDEEAVADEDISHNHAQLHRSLAKSFLEVRAYTESSL
jgi:hypothetical protein